MPLVQERLEAIQDTTTTSAAIYRSGLWIGRMRIVVLCLVVTVEFV